MAKIKRAGPEKLVAAFIYKEGAAYEAAKKILVQKLGEVDFESEELDFEHTDYYEAEMGKGLRRRFAAFKKLIEPQELADIKVFTNETEQKFLCPGTAGRSVNIDPGILCLSKFSLASAKNFSHRIYIGQGIYAEVTLIFRGKAYEKLDWTFPDYATEKYRGILLKIREIYKKQIE